MTKKKSNTKEAAEPKVEGESFDPPVIVEPEKPKRESCNALANRIWSGQSVSLPLAVRVARIVKGLRGHNYPESEIKAIKLPHENAHRFL